MITPSTFSFHDLRSHPENFREEIIAGLSRTPKQIPAKFFYDARGCELFEQICGLDEYYLARTETVLLQAHAGEITALPVERCCLIEYGSGSGSKTRILLDKLQPAAYLPIDIAPLQLQQSSLRIALDYPGMRVAAVCADYSRPLKLPQAEISRAKRKMVFFPGSTIGNFTPGEARDFLASTAKLVGDGGGMLVGVDLKKDRSILNAAYNDARGITAAFNLNLLSRINHELDADFIPENFRHHAYYNEAEGRIEMHLVSLLRQTVACHGSRFDFAAGETIHTENSYKYSVAEFRQLAASAGFKPAAVWMDNARLFSIHYLKIPGRRL